MLSGRIKGLLKRIFTKPLHGAIIIVNGVFNNITEDIMEYVIEGTVKELKEESGAWSFKIAGTDGYALRQKKKEKVDEEIRLNVLCLGENQVNDDKKPRNAITFAENSPIFDTENEEKNFYLLAFALANGRKCRICFLVKDKKHFDSKKCTISSLAMLAE